MKKVSFIAVVALAAFLLQPALAAFPINSTPVLFPVDSLQTTGIPGNLMTFTVSGYDPDGDALVYSVLNLPAGASFDPATQIFSWTPTLAQIGSFPVTFQATDGIDTATLDVTLVVNNVIPPSNLPPVLTQPSDITINLGATVVFTLQATDSDNDTLTFSSTNLPVGATLDPNSGIFAWKPTQIGTTNITFVVSDGQATDQKSMNVVVNQATNIPPVFDPIANQTIKAGSLLSFHVSATDANNDPIVYGSSNLPSGANLDHNTGLFEWTPLSAQVGTYSVEFSATDGKDTVYTTVVITVSSDVITNSPPVFNPISDQTLMAGRLFQLTVVATDPDPNTVLKYTANNLPSGSTFNNYTHVFSWTPSRSQAGTYSVIFKVSDGIITVSKTVKFTVVRRSNHD